uniref:3-oxoacyl-[acyl-carrier-protein] synthase 2 n=1 Tax=Eiseniibacteriota bacterium TaxID=2212470 RepID=A0A832I251_UNCEI
MSPRVIVTGLGITCPVGTGVARAWDALVHGRSGIGPIRAFDASALRSRIAGEVRDVDPAASLPSKLVKRTARFIHLALLAAFEALEDAGLPPSAREGTAVVAGTGVGGFEALEREHAAFLEKGPGRYHPLTVPMIIPNMAAGTVAMETGCRGPNLGVVTACASGGNAVGTALDLIRSGRCDAALAGATESTLSPFAVDGYCQLRALSTRNDEPERASRPFDRDRDGFVIAEGAAFLVLEREDRARARGARAWAEVAGYGASADGHHPTAPDPEGRGAVRALEAALADARVAAEDVQVVNAHGTSTPLNDPAETRVIRRVFGAHADRLMVHATKSMTGHALGAAGAIAAVVAALTVARGVVHPTVNLEHPDPECDLDYVPGAAREADVRCVVTNAFGFGGHNAVLVFRKA